MHSLGLKLAAAGSVSVNFNLCIQPLICAGPAGWGESVWSEGRILGLSLKFVYSALKFAVGRKAFGA